VIEKDEKTERRDQWKIKRRKYTEEVSKRYAKEYNH